jgi:GH24 family phage-related lysozyme (muramidase)
MIAPSQLFSTDPGKITDFSGVRPADVFNNAILPKLSSLESLLGEDPAGLEEASQRRNMQAQSDDERYRFNSQQDDAFLSQLYQNREQAATAPVTQDVDYNAPLPTPTTSASTAQPTNLEPQGAQLRSVPMAKNLTDFVKHFEGYNPKTYDDFKQMSIGYGTRARKGETSISKEEAESRLADELGKARSHVENLNEKYGYNFSPNQLDALTSFSYNVGSLNQLTENGKRDKATIARKILEYNKAGGKVLKGLVNRRKAEHNLFTQGY